MKTYMNETSLRIVGKSWEVRHRLRSLLIESPPTQTVAEYLTKRAKATGNGSRSPRSDSSL
ncbi:hypothetical protein [Paenibacillus sp. KN14-4R]|uniref:hypothetical protein n=1 Tax=Paenibacillus sp. KN14-4R TaxID=3445773 RepID=UPI003F9EF243